MAYVYAGGRLTTYVDSAVGHTTMSGTATSTVAAYSANILPEKRIAAKLKASAANANLKCILVSLILS